jgi:hypothetical protein
MLPSKGWHAYEDLLQKVGERRFAGDVQELDFLAEIGLAELQSRQLTGFGKQYFEARFIRGEEDRAGRLLGDALTDYRPAQAIVQLLAGVPKVNRSVVEIVLRSQGLDEGLTDRSLGSLIMIMARGGLLKYAKNTGQIIILAQPARLPEAPKSVFISPKTPFGNKVWLRRILEECEGFIYWLDKHFLAAGFEPLWEAADGNRISEVRILSLRLPDHQGRSLRMYRDLQVELKHRSISLEWRTLDSGEIRDTHDRWIIGSTSARNVPNVNAIFSGQNSELNVSNQHDQLFTLFQEYWAKGKVMA